MEDDVSTAGQDDPSVIMAPSTPHAFDIYIADARPLMAPDQSRVPRAPWLGFSGFNEHGSPWNILLDRGRRRIQPTRSTGPRSSESRPTGPFPPPPKPIHHVGTPHESGVSPGPRSCSLT